MLILIHNFILIQIMLFILLSGSVLVWILCTPAVLLFILSLLIVIKVQNVLLNANGDCAKNLILFAGWWVISFFRISAISTIPLLHYSNCCWETLASYDKTLAHSREHYPQPCYFVCFFWGSQAFLCKWTLLWARSLEELEMDVWLLGAAVVSESSSSPLSSSYSGQSWLLSDPSRRQKANEGKFCSN